MELAPEQQKGVDYCTDTNRRVVAITGQAGTGKTTIQKMAVDILRSRGRRVVLAAPTGRAARRIQEATGHPAVTIHKLLEYGKPVVDDDTGLARDPTFPNRNGDNPLDYIDVFVDEYMMVNEELHRNLTAALPRGGRLLAFGDVAQLPPIEPHVLVGYDRVPFERLLRLPSSVTLETVYRQAGDSGVLENARRIRDGRSPVRRPDFDIRISEVPVKELLDYVGARHEYRTLSDQVITPTRRGQLGTHALNTLLQNRFKPFQGRGMDIPRDNWNAKHPIQLHVGEKVICTENIYDMRDFFERYSSWDGALPHWGSYIPCPDAFTILNGEVGIVEDILHDGSLYIRLPDRLVQMPSRYRDYIPRYNNVYDRDPRKKIDLGYAITTHKMQGSECDNVTYLMHRSQAWLLNRNNIYTAVTRAKNSVFLITDGRSLDGAVRYTAAQKAKHKANAQQGGWSVGE